MYELYIMKKFPQALLLLFVPWLAITHLFYVHGMHTELINCTNVEREQTGSLFYSLHCTNFYGKWANVYVYE